MLLSSELGAYMWVWVEISVMKYRNIYQKRKIYNPVYWLYSFIWLINNTIDNNHCLDNLIQNIYVFEKTKPGTVLPFSGFHFCSILPFFLLFWASNKRWAPELCEVVTMKYCCCTMLRSVQCSVVSAALEL